MIVAPLKEVKFGKWKFSLNKSPVTRDYVCVKTKAITFYIFQDGSYEIDMNAEPSW